MTKLSVDGGKPGPHYGVTRPVMRRLIAIPPQYPLVTYPTVFGFPFCNAFIQHVKAHGRATYPNDKEISSHLISALRIVSSEMKAIHT